MAKISKFFVLVVFLSACFPTWAAGSVDNWRSEVDRLMEQGEFAQASKLMKRLPKKVRNAEAVTIDSLNQIMERIRKDFTLSPEAGVKAIREKMPEASDAQIANWKAEKAIEWMNIDGQEWWFRKAVRNLWLLGKEFAVTNAQENDEESKNLRKYVVEALRTTPDANGVRNWHHANITFTLAATHHRQGTRSIQPRTPRCESRCHPRRRNTARVDAYPLPKFAPAQH